MESLTDPVFKPVLQAHSNEIYFKALEQLALSPNAVWTLPPDMKCRAGAVKQMTKCAEELVTLGGSGRDALIAVIRDLLLLRCEEKCRGPGYIESELKKYKNGPKKHKKHLRDKQHALPTSAINIDHGSYPSLPSHSIQTHTVGDIQTIHSQTTGLDSQPVETILRPTASIGGVSR
jgi:hypothetical protein